MDTNHIVHEIVRDEIRNHLTQLETRIGEELHRSNQHILEVVEGELSKTHRQTMTQLREGTALVMRDLEAIIETSEVLQELSESAQAFVETEDEVEFRRRVSDILDRITPKLEELLTARRDGRPSIMAQFRASLEDIRRKQALAKVA